MRPGSFIPLIRKFELLSNDAAVMERKQWYIGQTRSWKRGWKLQGLLIILARPNDLASSYSKSRQALPSQRGFLRHRIQGRYVAVENVFFKVVIEYVLQIPTYCPESLFEYIQLSTSNPLLSTITTKRDGICTHHATIASPIEL
jgi:hypothetical protein